MFDLQKLDKATLTIGLATLLTTGMATWLGFRLSPQGDWLVPKPVLASIGSGIVTAFLGVVSYTFRLWRRDRKRERIRFAREMGRLICGCTDTGEITRTEDLVIDHVKFGRIHRCPVCQKKYEFPE